MMKKLMLGAAVSALLVSGALAATPEPREIHATGCAQKSTPTMPTSMPPAAAQTDKAAGRPIS